MPPVTWSIVGCGPSVARLEQRHLGDGPVVLLNSAATYAAAKRLTGWPLYALYYEGCPLREECEDRLDAESVKACTSTSASRWTACSKGSRSSG